ncbi:MAG: UDP-N-acetylglucosamine 2-epimerase, partial [Anaerolineales bacterium]|nr:UDP-N-acetylglucosamine 2-epimerase [Anaerolineales bacterium]
RLKTILDALMHASQSATVVFPVHPRTRQRIEEYSLDVGGGNIRMVDPLGYLDFLALESRAALVVTDSGGLQEETTFLGVPCLTVRPNTERPVTITQGTNRLVEDIARLSEEITDALDRPRKSTLPPDLWDGRAAGRIVEVFLSLPGA